MDPLFNFQHGANGKVFFRPLDSRLLRARLEHQTRIALTNIMPVPDFKTAKDSALGAVSIAEHVHRAAERYPIYVALHTDHCLEDKLDKFVFTLVEEAW
jgi:fructose/tagatose bisphosphate aldolase